MGTKGHLVPASEAASVAGGSVQTVYNDVAKGAPGEDVGGHLMVPKDEYKAWRDAKGHAPRKGGGRPRGVGSAPAVIKDADGNELTIAKIKILQESVRLEAETLELEKAKGTLVEREDIELAWGQLLQEVRTTLETMPAMVAAEASKAGLSEKQAFAVREACTERVAAVLDTLEKGAA